MTGLVVYWRTEVRADDVHGRPDLGVTVKGLLTGHVELKRPGLGARPEHFTGANRAQWLRFSALPNLIYTDGSEWSLYHAGKLVARVRIADDVSEGGARALNRECLPDLANLFREFLYWEPVVPARRKVSRSSWQRWPVSSATRWSGRLLVRQPVADPRG